MDTMKPKVTFVCTRVYACACVCVHVEARGLCHVSFSITPQSYLFLRHFLDYSSISFFRQVLFIESVTHSLG